MSTVAGMDNACILVTDGDQRSALAVVRSLGKVGHEVHVGSTSGHSLAGASRHVRSEAELPDSLAKPHAFADALLSIAQRLHVDVLVPVTDPSILAVLEEDRLASDFTLPLPSLESYRGVSDKAHLLYVARRIGIPVPESRRLETSSDLDSLSLETVSPPYVIKPSRSVAGAKGRRVETSVSYAGSRRELRRSLGALPSASFPVLIQEYVPGRGHGVFLLRWGGDTLASFAHRRLREKPPSGGVSVYRESVCADPEVVAASEKLLDAFDWSGVAMVEYRVSDADGVPYLMEVNGRFWGSLQLAIDAGVDFPALLVAAALGNDPDPVDRYRTGLRSRWCWGDVDHLLALLRGATPTGDGGRRELLSDLAHVIVPWRPGERTEVLRVRDPAPFLRETRQWLREAVRRGQ